MEDTTTFTIVEQPPPSPWMFEKSRSTLKEIGVSLFMASENFKSQSTTGHTYHHKSASHHRLCCCHQIFKV
ncbi:unnamed protein product [Lactuca virosa]|nr:unnamed protein product [Lactuca virosa]